MNEINPAFEQFPTPVWCVEAALNLIPQSPIPGIILDAGAGTGIWGQVAKRRWPGAWVIGCEIDERHAKPGGFDEWEHFDFLEPWYGEAAVPIDLIISNPPFTKGEAFIRKALQMVHPDGGRVVMLLPLAYLAGIDRGNGLWMETPLERVVILCRRPSFTGNGKTESVEYAIYVWQNGYTGRPAIDWIRGEKAKRTKKVKQAELVTA